MEEKERLLEETITKLTKMMESRLYMANHHLVGFETVQGGLTIQKECKTIGIMTEANELVREIPKKEMAQECNNLVIGSSIIGKL